MKQTFKKQTKFIYRSNRFAAFWAMLLIMLCSSAAVFAQITIKRTVTDINGDPLIGVNVFIKGITIGNIPNITCDISSICASSAAFRAGWLYP